MKNLLIVSCLVIILAGCSGNSFDAESLKAFPRYETVYRKAFGQHSSNVDDKWFLKLARKADGWYLVKMDSEQREQEFYLFWSAREKKYLPFPKEIDRPGDPRLANPLPGDVAMFRIIPFYGYNRWYEDVITHFDDNAGDNDTLMEALGRAWSAKASAEAGLNYGQNREEVVRKFSAEQEKAFIANMDKALAVYQKLEKKNPRYNTFVGSVHNKYSNECINAYSTLRYFGDPNKATVYLREGLYSNVFNCYAENILNSCEKNAVLITYGDNDYYPLIYAQDKLHIRPDVAVLNMSLMVLDVYIEKFQKKYSLKHTLSEEVYRNKTFDFIALSSKSDTVNIQKAFADFNSGNIEPYLLKDITGTEYLQLDNNVLRFDDVSVPETGRGFYMRLGQSYALKNDIFLWDLLYTNAHERAVSLTTWGIWNAYQPLLKEKGLVYTFAGITPAETETRSQLDTAGTEELLMRKFKYGWSGKNYNETENRIAGNYLYIFMKLANAYADTGNKEKAMAIIKTCLKIFPQETLPANTTYCFMARTLQLCGDEETAVNIDLRYLADVEQALAYSSGQEYEDYVRGVQNIFVLADKASPKWIVVVDKASALLKKFPSKMSSEGGRTF